MLIGVLGMCACGDRCAGVTCALVIGVLEVTCACGDRCAGDVCLW